MTLSYLRELAKAATLKNELKQAYKYQHMGISGSDHFAVSWNGQYRLVDNCREDLCDDVVKTWEFFIAVQPQLIKLLDVIETYRNTLKEIGFQQLSDEYEVEHDGEEMDLENAAEAYEMIVIQARTALVRAEEMLK